MLTRTLIVAAAATTLFASTSVADTLYPQMPLAFIDPDAAMQVTPIDRDCTQLERSAGMRQDECGTLPLSFVAQLKAERDEDGDSDS
ncbi:MAG: hypothetical protein AAGJ91_10020 [Pseudomonadota bacterium]